MSLNKKKNVFSQLNDFSAFRGLLENFEKLCDTTEESPMTEPEIISANFVTIENENSPVGVGCMCETNGGDINFVYLKNTVGGRYYNLFSASASMFTALFQCEKFVDIMIMVLEETNKLAPTAENEQMLMAAYNTKNIITMSKVYATRGEKAAIEFGNSVNLATTAPPSGAKQ